MHRRLLEDGPRRLTVSELCLGTMMFGTTIDQRTAFEILDRYLEAGGTFLDTANCYAFWADGGTGAESETLLGEWLRSGNHRDQVVIASKLGAGPGDPSRPYDAANREGLSPTVIEGEVATSLRRLGTDHLDLLYAHADDRSTPLDETLAALDRQVEAGNVGMLAASNYTTWRLALARGRAHQQGYARFAAAQLRHTYLDPRPQRRPLTEEIQLPLTAELRDYATAEGDLTLLAYSPLLGGAYTRSDRPLPEVYDHPGSTNRLRELSEVATDLGATANQVVLAWMLASDPPILPVIGVSSVSQLNECLEALDLDIDDETLARLDAA
jgi:aryl-alcohol dehydrogenase-like predicted oxidoreductase